MPVSQCVILLLAVNVLAATVPADLPALRLVPKPADNLVERRAHVQPRVPEGAKEIPFEETALEPNLTTLEKE